MCLRARDATAGADIAHFGSRLTSVVINEGVGFSAVTYYLAFITQGDTELVSSPPRLLSKLVAPTC